MHQLPPLRTCCSTDPAVDVAATLKQPGGFSEFHKTRDPSKLVFRTGQDPAYYTIGRIAHGPLFGWVEQGATTPIKYYRAFGLGVTRIEGVVSNATGQPIALLEHNPHKAVRLGPEQVTTFEDEDMAHVHPDDLQEIGEVAYQRAFLRLGSAPCYRAPLSFPDALERAVAALPRVDASETPGQNS